MTPAEQPPARGTAGTDSAGPAATGTAHTTGTATAHTTGTAAATDPAPTRADGTGDAASTSDDERGARGQAAFALNEDWAAVIVGLAVLLLALAGVITEGWLVL